MDYIYEFFLFIVATLTGNWLWQLWLDKRETKKQKAKTLNECLEKIQSCILELEYNATPGVGGPRCPFRLKALEQLLHSTEVSLLGEELTNSLKQLITDATETIQKMNLTANSNFRSPCYLTMEMTAGWNPPYCKFAHA